MRVNNNLEFFLWIKLLKLNADDKTSIPPCRMKAQICINLYEFIEQWRQAETTLYEAGEAVKEALNKIQTAFDCPLLWLMTAQRAADRRLGVERLYVERVLLFAGL